MPAFIIFFTFALVVGGIFAIFGLVEVMRVLACGMMAICLLALGG